MVFKVGDVVELMSGGPRMTVIELDDDNCICNWFASKAVESGSFPSQALKPYSEDIPDISQVGSRFGS